MPSYLIGRGDQNDVVLSNTTVSRQHAELIDEGSGAYRLRDLGSINGTFYFGMDGWVPATFAKLDADDLVRIGKYETSITALLASVGVKPIRKPRDDETESNR